MQARVLAMLVVVYVFNLVDRNLMSMLIDSINWAIAENSRSWVCTTKIL